MGLVSVPRSLSLPPLCSVVAEGDAQKKRGLNPAAVCAPAAE